jgi:hypothetical protein
VWISSGNIIPPDSLKVLSAPLFSKDILQDAQVPTLPSNSVSAGPLHILSWESPPGLITGVPLFLITSWNFYSSWNLASFNFLEFVSVRPSSLLQVSRTRSFFIPTRSKVVLFDPSSKLCFNVKVLLLFLLWVVTFTFSLLFNVRTIILLLLFPQI